MHKEQVQHLAIEQRKLPAPSCCSDLEAGGHLSHDLNSCLVKLAFFLFLNKNNFNFLLPLFALKSETKGVSEHLPTPPSQPGTALPVS